MHLQELDKQVSKLALTVSRLESQVPLPFPGLLIQCKKERDEKKILDTFRKVEINIPLLDAIKQIPQYAKFLKELCTSKRKLLGNEKVSVGENVFAVLQRKIPPKYKDHGMFSISCKISSVGIKKAMCDLGASINVIPLSIYKLLNAGPLKETDVIIQLTDRSVVHPGGVLEDVLVKMKIRPMLIGRPFLSTAQTKIDVRSGILTMEFDGEVVKFNVYEALNRPSVISNAPELELKSLPSHLKYAFLGEGNSLPVIILSKLSKVEEENLVRVLREYKEVIG
ncbi:hypothetical protein V6Z12_A07G111500 [Gossypium hirsutum]